MPYTYEYPRPALTVDCVVFAFDPSNKSLKVLLIQRLADPFKDSWALPGGFVEMEEDIETAAKRELKEETSMENIFLEQLYTFGTLGRDPRGRVVSVAYYALIPLQKAQTPIAASDAKAAKWFSIDKLPPLAFDHNDILQLGLQRLRGKVRYQPIGFELLDEKFSLSDLQRLYETVLGVQLDKRNFRKKLAKMGVLIETDEYQQNVPHRAARLYRFDKEKYHQLIHDGFNFEL